jgi:hypothetical protein
MALVISVPGDARPFRALCYYARYTVLKAQAEMQRTGTGPDEMRTEQARVDSKGL